MTVPNIFNTDFVRYEDLSSSDVNDVVADIATILTTTLPVGSRWTDLTGNEYQSPAIDPTGANHYMRVKVAATTQYRLQFHTKDPAGNTIFDGEVDFSGTMQYRIWAGPYHLAVELEYAGPTYEVAWASLVNPTPLPHTSIGLYIACCTRRTNTGAATGSNWTNEAVMADTYGASVQKRIATNQSQAGGCIGNTSAGSKVVLPVDIGVFLIDKGYSSGKCYQMVLVPTSVAYKTTLTVPLDNGVTGDFEVCGKPDVSTYNGRLAFRRA